MKIESIVFTILSFVFLLLLCFFYLLIRATRETKHIYPIDRIIRANISNYVQ